MTPQEDQDIIAELEAEFGTGFSEIGVRESTSLPADKYTFSVENAYLNRSQQTGRKQLVATLVVAACQNHPDLAGRNFFKTWGLQTEQNLQWLNSDLTNLDIALPTQPKDLARVANDLIGICFDATLVENKDPQYPPNMYINAGARRKDIQKGAVPNTTANTKPRF